jgi:ubiquinone/menaquinone biosynthesis C-methylase UbiE
VTPMSRDGVLKSEVEAYFERTTEGPHELRAKQVRWRSYCFESGLEYARYVEDSHLSLEGKRALDVACGWGGHALALANRGAHVVAADLNDFSFVTLADFARRQALVLVTVRCDGERLPFASAAFDFVLALELVEHVPDPQRFAFEVARVLRPGGVCILSTPARLRSFLLGEPHYGLRGIAILPLSWQRKVATDIFRRTYPFPIMRQYVAAGHVLRPFLQAGLEGAAVISGRPAVWLGKIGMRRLGEVFFWNFFVVRRPA